MAKPYILDKQAQQHLNNGINTLWQANTLLEFVQKSLTDDEHADLHTALNGVLALMNNGLTDLAEV